MIFGSKFARNVFQPSRLLTGGVCNSKFRYIFLFCRHLFWSTMWKRWLLSSLQMILLCKLLKSLPNNNSILKISQKPCTANGYGGTCMFVWECIKSEGQHVGKFYCVLSTKSSNFIKYWQFIEYFKI